MRNEPLDRTTIINNPLPSYEGFCCLSACDLRRLGIISFTFEPEISSGWQLERT